MAETVSGSFTGGYTLCTYTNNSGVETGTSFDYFDDRFTYDNIKLTAKYSITANSTSTGYNITISNIRYYTSVNFNFSNLSGAKLRIMCNGTLLDTLYSPTSMTISSTGTSDEDAGYGAAAINPDTGGTSFKFSYPGQEGVNSVNLVVYIDATGANGYFNSAHTSVPGGPVYLSKSESGKICHFSYTYATVSTAITLPTLLSAPTSTSVVCNNKLNNNAGVSNSTSQVQLKLNCSGESISGYYFSKDGGSSYVSHDGNIYTFTGLSANTSYTFKAYCKNAAGSSTVRTVTVRTRKNKPTVSLSLNNPTGDSTSVSDSTTLVKTKYTYSNCDSVTIKYQTKITGGSYGRETSVTVGSSGSTFSVTNNAGADKVTYVYTTITGTNSDYTDADTATKTSRTLYPIPTITVLADSGLESITYTITPSRSGKVQYRYSTTDNWTNINSTDSDRSQTLSRTGLNPGTSYTAYFRTVSASSSDSRMSNTTTKTQSTDSIASLSVGSKSSFSFAYDTIVVNKNNSSGSSAYVNINVKKGSGSNVTRNRIATEINLGTGAQFSWTPTQAEIDDMYGSFDLNSNTITLELTPYTRGSGSNIYQGNSITVTASIDKNSVMKTGRVSVNGVIKRCRIWIGDSNNVPRPAIGYVSVDGNIKRTK